MKTIHRLVAVMLVMAIFAVPALAEEQPLLSDIELEGLTRIDSAAIFEKLTQKPGVPISPEAVTYDIKTIFAMGYFDDVSAELVVKEGGLKLVYKLKEKPSIRRVDFYGNEEVSDSDVEKGITISPGSMADMVLIRQNAENIKAELADEGYPKAAVTPILRHISEQNLLLTYYIEEGPEVRIDDISFDGNEAFSDGALRGLLETKQWWFMSGLTGSGYIRRADLLSDVDRLLQHYHSKGYVKVVVHDPVVQYDEEYEWLDVSFSIEEGVQYSIANITFSGSDMFSEQQMLEAIKLRPSDVLNRTQLMADVTSITEMFSAEGYALATAYPNFKVNDADRLVDIEFRITRGDLFRVGRIEITGNTKTHDKVIRREFRFSEGDTFDSRKLKKSYRALTNLNFFGDIKIDPRPDAATGKLDINLEVKEKLTGSFNVGGGYSSVDKLMAMMDLEFGNFGGRGQYLKLKSQFSSTSTTYEIEFKDPWFLDRPLNFSFSIYDVERDYTEYTLHSKGFSVGLGKRFAEFWSAGAKYKYDNNDVFDVDATASSIIRVQEGQSVTSSISPYLARDTRDNYMMPHEGSKNLFKMTYAGLGGDNNFIKAQIDSQFIFPVTKRTELSLRGRYGFARGIGDSSLPLYERFRVGSVFTVRGLRYIGPEAPDGEYIGGGQMVIFNAEYTIPATDQGMLKWLIYYDAGTAFDKEINLRHTAGAGFKWYSPIGPMSLIWAKNLDPLVGETGYRWEFAVGAMF